MRRIRNIVNIIVLVLCSCYLLEAQNTYPVLPNGWHVHDEQRPIPEKVTPGKTDSQAPSDAIVLFDGKDFSQWESIDSTSIDWKLEDGYMEVVPKTGSIQTKKTFGDIQLHLEWSIPSSAFAKGQKKAIGGVFLMGLYKIQIAHYLEKTYADGIEGAIYGQNPPLVNASKEIGEWQSYDIIFKAPVFENDKLVSPAYCTILQNGVLIQNHTEIYGPAAYKATIPYKSHPSKLPIMLQDHKCDVRFRNIWVRQLN